MSDLISRQAAIDKAYTIDLSDTGNDIELLVVDVHEIEKLPSAQPERKKGKWLEKHHAYSDEEFVIEEWQSCKCSEYGRYDTRPYLYYFSEPKFCSWCGARMDGEE